jgi:hypothetical protein
MQPWQPPQNKNAQKSPAEKRQSAKKSQMQMPDDESLHPLPLPTNRLLPTRISQPKAHTTPEARFGSRLRRRGHVHEGVGDGARQLVVVRGVGALPARRALHFRGPQQ